MFIQQGGDRVGAGMDLSTVDPHTNKRVTSVVSQLLEVISLSLTRPCRVGLLGASWNATELEGACQRNSRADSVRAG